MCMLHFLAGFSNDFANNVFLKHDIGNRIIDIHSFWRPNIQIVKIAIRFSTNVHIVIFK